MFIHSLAVFFQRSCYRFVRTSRYNNFPLNFCVSSRNNRIIMPPKKRAAKEKTTEPPVKKTITKDKDDKKKATKKDKKEVEEKVNDEKKDTIEASKVQANGDVPIKETRSRRVKATDDKQDGKQVQESSRKPVKRIADVLSEEGSSNTKQAKTVTTRTNKKAPAAASKQSKTKKQTENIEEPVEEQKESQSETEEIEEAEEKQPESPKKAVKKAAGSKKKNEKTTVEEKEEETKPKKKTRAKKGDTKAAENGGGEVDTLKNNTTTKWTEIDFKATRLNSSESSYNLHIQSWNVDGVRAWLKKGGLEVLKYAQPDIFCLQETKCSLKKLPEELKTIEDYKAYWSCCENKEGYSGVGILTKIMPIEVIYGIESGDDEFDKDGRCITAEFKYFYLVNTYVPNAGRNLVTLGKRLEWNQLFRKFVKKLDQKKPVIVCGDLNVAHNEIDLTNPKANVKHAGFTVEEREGMSEFLNDGYVDTFRKLYPEKTGAYTFWTYLAKARAKNVGWRLDYYLVSDRIMDKVCDNRMHPEVYGSDHCPISLYLNFQ